MKTTFFALALMASTVYAEDYACQMAVSVNGAASTQPFEISIDRENPTGSDAFGIMDVTKTHLYSSWAYSIDEKGVVTTTIKKEDEYSPLFPWLFTDADLDVGSAKITFVKTANGGKLKFATKGYDASGAIVVDVKAFGWCNQIEE